MQFPLLLQTGFQRGAESVEGKTALGLQNLVGQFLLLLVEIGGIGLLLFGYAINEPVGAEIERGADVTGLELEGDGDLLAADGAGDGAVAGEKIAGFGFQAEGFGGGVKFFAGLDALGEILRLGAGELGGFLLLQLGDDFVADFFERTGVGGLNLLDGEDEIATVGANGEAELILSSFLR